MTGAEGGGRVVVVGAVNVDLVLRVTRLPGPGETVASADLVTLGGGKAANMAAASAQRARTALVAGIGDDDFGAAALADLERAGVDVAGVRRVPGVPTGVAAVVTSAQDNQIVIAPGANAHLGAPDVQAALSTLGVDDRWCCVVSTEVPTPTATAALRAASSAGALVIVNPSPVASFDADDLTCGPLLVVNEHEATQLGGGAAPVAAAEVLMAKTGQPVVVTLGADGAAVVTADGSTVVPAPHAAVVDTTGAGDAFTGTLAAALASGDSLLDAHTSRGDCGRSLRRGARGQGVARGAGSVSGLRSRGRRARHQPRCGFAPGLDRSRQVAKAAAS